MVPDNKGLWSNKTIKETAGTLLMIFLMCFYYYATYTLSRGNRVYTFLQYEPVTDYNAHHIQPVSANTTMSVAENITEWIPRKGYAVWSPDCRIPEFGPNHRFVKQFAKSFKLPKCAPKTFRPMVAVRYNKTSKRYQIEMNQPWLLEKERPTCCYYVINRKTMQDKSRQSDNEYSLGPEVCFASKATLPAESEFIYSTCYNKKAGEHRKEIFSDIYATVPEKTQVPKNGSKSGPNVLIFGIDSVSRINFVRSMPITAKLLESEGWISMKGYTKVADNTFPNLIPILTGLNTDQLQKRCYKSAKQPLDPCPFIWKDFKNLSYATVYVEDEPHMSTFNFNKFGFSTPPTDYYMRPYMLAAHKLLKTVDVEGLNYCLGTKSTIARIMQYCTEIVTRLRDRPYFAFFWSNSFSHNNLNEPTAVDNTVARFLHTLANITDNTIIIFLSDHGMRWGPIRETFVGWLEERTPFVHFWIPSKFRRENPKKIRNLLINRNRLTSPFDLHLTLRDILHHSSAAPDGSSASNSIAEGCPSCKSLFQEISWSRSCEEAAIESHWCTCFTDYVTIANNDPIAIGAAKYVIGYINQILLKAHQTGKCDKGTQCAYLKLNKVLSARRKLMRNVETNEYIVVFETTISRARFETTVRYSDKGFFNLFY